MSWAVSWAVELQVLFYHLLKHGKSLSEHELTLLKGVIHTMSMSWDVKLQVYNTEVTRLPPCFAVLWNNSRRLNDSIMGSKWRARCWIFFCHWCTDVVWSRQWCIMLVNGKITHKAWQLSSQLSSCHSGVNTHPPRRSLQISVEISLTLPPSKKAY